MIIYRRIFGKIESESMKANLEEVLEEDLGWSYFSKDVDQESDMYNMVKSYKSVYNLQDDILGTTFSDSEIKSADILLLRGVWSFAYPEPQEPKFIENTYSHYCLQCGVSSSQINDFKLKKDPKLKFNKVVMLHWVTDELFCNPKLYNSFFKSLGLSSRSVKIYKKNMDADSVLQLVIPEIKEELDMGQLPYEVCSKCGKKRYLPTIIGNFPSPKNKNFTIVKTNEYFGTGHSAGQRILISKEVMRFMVDQKLAKYHQFIPCK